MRRERGMSEIVKREFRVAFTAFDIKHAPMTEGSFKEALECDRNVEGRCDLNVEGRCDLNVEGRCDLNVEGRCDLNVEGQCDLNVEGQCDLNVPSLSPFTTIVQTRWCLSPCLGASKPLNVRCMISSCV